MMLKLPFTKSEYEQRQESLLNSISKNDIVIITTNDVMIRSNDVNYPFRANSYMLYLCGWEEENSILLMEYNGSNWIKTLYVNPTNTEKEIWEGRRQGVEGARKFWPVDNAKSIHSLFEDLVVIKSKNKKIHINQKPKYFVDLIVENLESIDSFDNFLSNVNDVNILIDKLRVIKSNSEIKHMRASCAIASSAIIQAMKKSYSGMGEWELQAIIEQFYKMNKSQTSYIPIIGGGDNSTILHYKKNNSVIDEESLVLVDAGCEINGYASDITRTWPINGTFTKEQKEIYKIVLKAQKAAIESCQVGFDWNKMHESSVLHISEGLLELGIIDADLGDIIGENFDGRYRDFFMHGTGHLLGLDVHDVGGGRKGDDNPGPSLQPGMIVTVEPGLYFSKWRSDVSIPDKYAGIGIRIEDNILITENGPEIITKSCPKEIEDIEVLIGNK